MILAHRIGFFPRNAKQEINLTLAYRDNENDQDNENHPDNKNKGNYPASKYIFKVNNRKKVLVSLYFTPCSSVLMSILNM